MSEAEQFKADFDRILEAGIRNVDTLSSGASGVDVVYSVLRAMQHELEAVCFEKKEQEKWTFVEGHSKREYPRAVKV